VNNEAIDQLPTGLLIGADWIFDSSGGELEHVNPSTGRVQRSFPAAGAAEIDAAVEAARQGLASWRKCAPSEKRAIMQRIAKGFRDHADELARIGILETGLIRNFAGVLPLAAAEWFDYYAGWSDKVEGKVISTPSGFDYTVPEPFGVVGIIVTWNGPVGGIGMSVAAPLAAGCSVVLKAPELSPFSSSLIGRICVDAGLPPGVLNVVVGGPEAGNHLVKHRGVDKIGFTGSPATGRLIQAAAAESLKPLVLELGGKSANIVFADADLDVAVAAAVAGITSINGQTCISPTRLLVQHQVYEEVSRRVADAMIAIKVGDPFASETAMGPVISKGACDRIMSMIHEAKETSESELLVGGERLEGELSEGFFVQPTAFKDVANDSAIAQNELFGPVLAMMPFGEEDEAIHLANDTKYGLAAYVHTMDVSRVIHMSSQLDAGNISVNGGTAVAGPYAPFGGFKQSGYGKEGGLAGLMEYVRVKNVNIGITQ
jgi:aldehyde dehydrogenase (NAD+)